MEIGTIIEQERKRQGMSRLALSEASGVEQSTIARIEYGSTPSVIRAGKLLAALGLHARIGAQSGRKRVKISPT